MAKIDRALIIRRQGVELSKQYAADCAKSCEKHNLPYEFIDAVEFLECEKAFESVGAKTSPTYKNTMGNCCCHASHIKCWKRIVEIDKPCIILEHDAIVKGDVRNIEIPDMSATTFGHRVADINDYNPVGPAKEFIEISRAVGVHACGLTPNTAQWLWEQARDKGVSVGVDKWLMMRRASKLPLYVCHPEQVVCWSRTSTSNFKEGEQGKDGKKSSVTNYKEAFSPSWRKGLTK
jgi:GR25 family glycosyltransferase involved in LPS biosynthesis